MGRAISRISPQEDDAMAKQRRTPDDFAKEMKERARGPTREQIEAETRARKAEAKLIFDKREAEREAVREKIEAKIEAVLARPGALDKAWEKAGPEERRKFVKANRDEIVDALADGPQSEPRRM
jgi:hypothetical protein